MVFESIVADLLNRVLGEYIQDLDYTQLKLSLWGGDLVLKDLLIKESALDKWDLPIKLEYGRLGNLRLRIPFKDMWNAQIDIIIEELFILMVPVTQIAYNEEKETKAQLEVKRKELLKIEQRKQLVDGKPQEKLNDSMLEKLLARMIKNIHVEIKKIHIRYEDHISDKMHPFSIAATLNTFVLESCTSSWEVIKEDLKEMYAIPQIFKLCNLDGLAVYLNVDEEQYNKSLSSSTLLYDAIATMDYTQLNYQYLLGPININCKIKLNPKPESDGSDYTIPKVWLDLEMQKLRIALTKQQYRTLVRLSEGLQQAQKATPYRKYRPNLLYRGHYKEWWHFAYTCVLEETVRRRRRNWDWNHIKQYRDLCRRYVEAYQTKLTAKKVTKDLEEELTYCEMKLDIINLVIIRQQIQIEVEKAEEAKKQKHLKKKGWFDFLWSNSQEVSEEETRELNSALAILNKFEEAMTSQEKEKLYQAIDYQENKLPTHYPERYETITMYFFLHGLQILLLDTDKKHPCVLDLQLHGVRTDFKSRSSANSISVNVSISDMKLLGVMQNSRVPLLLNPGHGSSDSALLSIFYEKNPIDKLCGDRIIVNSRSVDIIYDAQTIIELVDLFKVHDVSTRNHLQLAAAERLENLKEMSALGLEYAIQHHSSLDIQVDMQASQLIIPYGGFYEDLKALIIINLGNLKVQPLQKEKITSVTVKQLISMGKSDEEVLSHLKTYSYDRFFLEIVNFQILITLPNEEWRTALTSVPVNTTLRLLHPTSLEIQFHKCLVTDDPRLPKLRLIGHLPSMTVNISDIRLLQALSIIQSIPMPEKQTPLEGQIVLSKSVSQMSLKEVGTTIEKKKQKVHIAAMKQTTDLEMAFQMKEFTLLISKHQDDNISEFIRFQVLQLEIDMLQRTYDQEVKLRLGGVQIRQHYENEKIFMVNTPMSIGQDAYLITIRYMNVNKRSPEFVTRHDSVVQFLQLNFTSLDILLHQQALLELLQYSTKIQDQVSALKNIEKKKVEHQPSFRPSQLISIQEETSGFFKEQLQKRRSTLRRKKLTEYIDLKITINVSSINLKISNVARNIAAMQVEGIHFNFLSTSLYSQIIVELSSIGIKDLNPASIYKDIVAVEGTESLQFQVIMYDIEQCKIDKYNMSINLTMSCHRIVFLNAFVSSIMNFLNNFQTAQQAIREASAAATEVAKTNMKNVQESISCIKLDINIKAPIIYIPMNSRSKHSLMLDMGNLKINNFFVKPKMMKEDTGDPIVDNMKIDLQNVKLSRIRLDITEFTIQNEVLLLEPVTFLLIIKRNLSTAWFTSIPDIDISGNINKINLLFSKEDYVMIMKVFEQNFSETFEELRPSIQAAPSLLKLEPSRLQIQPVYKYEIDAMPMEPPVAEKELHKRISVNFKFYMESLVINLFTGGSKLLQSQISPLRTPDHRLACFSLTHLNMIGRIFADGLMETRILLMNCTLDDTRRESSMIRIMERINVLPTMPNEDLGIDNEYNSRNMLDITVRQSPNELFVDARVFSFSIIVSLDYLLKIKDFFDINDRNKISKTHIMRSESMMMLYKKQQQAVQTRQQIIAAAPKMLMINLYIEKPDIILLEDMDNIDSNCIILNMQLLLKIQIMGEHQMITGSIKDFSILTGIYNPAKRADWIYEVLKPCSININGSTPEGKGLHVEVLFTDIHISVSPGVIEILNRVIQTVMMEKEEKEIEIIKSEPDYERLWMITPFEEYDYWFLKTEVAMEAFEEFTYLDEEIAAAYKPELAVILAPTILFTLEAGVGNKTLPMLLLHASFQSNIMDWSTRSMTIDSTISMVIAYYNSRLALWEPLVEPVEKFVDDKYVSTPWELKTKIQFHDIMIDSKGASAASSPSDAELYQASTKISIDVASYENLEITVTKTCLDVLNQLVQAFSSAMDKDRKEPIKKMAPFILKNETGLTMILDLEQSIFKIFNNNSRIRDNSDMYMQVILESGASIELARKVSKLSICLVKALKAESVRDRDIDTFVVSFKGIQDKLTIPVLKADKRFFPLKHRKEDSEEWGIVSDVNIENGSTIITLRSILQVHNHFDQPVFVYYMTKRGNEVECVGIVAPNDKFNLPLDVVYTPTNIYWLFFSVDEYMVSVEPFIWKDLQKTVSATKLLKCEPRSKQVTTPFYIQVTGQIEQVYLENTNRHTMISTIYNVHLYPPVYLKNFLPIDIIVCLPDNAKENLIEPSATVQLPIDPVKSNIIIKLPNYLDRNWSCLGEIIMDPAEFAIWSFESFDSTQMIIMDLGMHTLHKHGSMIMGLYCPFWMLNKTGLMLCYKAMDDYMNIMYHPENFRGPILFSFRSKAFFSKKKAVIRIEDGPWSNKFSIDVAGSQGVVACKHNGMIHQIGVHNQLTYNSLTKQITFTPYYVLINNADFLIECQENDGRIDDELIKVPPGECVALWPRSEHKTLKAKVADLPEKTPAFTYNESQMTLLKLNNKYGGINIDIQISEGGIYISMSAYSPGDALALIINHTQYTIDLWEKGSINVKSLQSHNKMFYAWENPTGPRKLIWEDSNGKEIGDTLHKDNLGIFQLLDINQELYYVSFLLGMQRVLLFTANLKIAEDCQLAGDLEAIDQEITLNIHGIGFSLVNNITNSELLYMCIASSGIIWETRKSLGGRWQPLEIKIADAIEEGYQRYIKELQVDEIANYRILLEPKLKVDYMNMQMLQPHRRYMRRTYRTGFWLQYRTSTHQVQLHVKINKLQIDNQLQDYMFPVILAPVPLPKTIARIIERKPFAELSMVKRLLQHSNVQQFRYFKALVQEFHIKLDIVFINAIINFFEAGEISDVEESNFFRIDMNLVNEPLMYYVVRISTAEQPNFFDLVHFSPLKIHVSFSMISDDEASSAMPHVVHVLSQGVGVTLTDIHDIVFKLAYFERTHIFMTREQFIREMTFHYAGQAIKQAYVLILGLDVIGNPYGLVVGTIKGIEDLFYEPFQGAIQGPGEFAEGLFLGLRSMLGHTVGGMADAMSKITGAMGKGIAVLTFDKEYQRKRLEQLHKPPAKLQEGLAQSGKDLVMGVVDGVTGVVIKPISGAKEEGVEGFFKGVGKGVVGLVTRPTAGIIDFASGSFGAVKRATEVNDEVKRLRSPRFLQPDGLVRPYIKSEADGNKILIELEKGKYASTDVYFYHMYFQKDVLLLTDKRLLYLEHNDLFGGWRIQWTYTWNEFTESPKIVEKGVQIFIKDIKKKLGLFGVVHHLITKTFLIAEHDIKELLCNKIQEQISQYKV